MKAIILRGTLVYGHHENPNIEEFESLGTQYELVEELPDIILNTPEGHYVQRNDNGEYELIAYPEPAPKPPDRVTLLEQDNAFLALELIESQIRLEQAESNQGYMFLKLVDKGVI